MPDPLLTTTSNKQKARFWFFSSRHEVRVEPPFLASNASLSPISADHPDGSLQLCYYNGRYELALHSH